MQAVSMSSVARRLGSRALFHFSTASEASQPQSNFVPSAHRPYEWIREDSTPAVAVPWSPSSVRTGLVGKKAGMMQIFDQYGQRVPVTVIQLPDLRVVEINHTKCSKGLVGLRVAFDTCKAKLVSKSEISLFKQVGILPKRKIVQFRVSEDAVLPPGFQINARHLVPGQFVDVQGVTIGKGFAGAMKRHGFAGLNATHGVSLTHRSVGSTGSNQVCE